MPAAMFTEQKPSLELFFAGGDIDRAADLYTLGFDEASTLAASLIAVLAPDAVLEVGAGVGTTTTHVHKHLSEGTAYCFTDVSPAFLDRARQRFARPGLRPALFDLDLATPRPSASTPPATTSCSPPASSTSPAASTHRSLASPASCAPAAPWTCSSTPASCP